MKDYKDYPRIKYFRLPRVLRLLLIVLGVIVLIIFIMDFAFLFNNPTYKQLYENQTINYNYSGSGGTGGCSTQKGAVMNARVVKVLLIVFGLPILFVLLREVVTRLAGWQQRCFMDDLVAKVRWFLVRFVGCLLIFGLALLMLVALLSAQMVGG